LKVELEPPSSFLKKGTGTSPVRTTGLQKAESSPERPGVTKPPVPRHDELAPLAERTSRNFIQDNTLDVLRTVPKKPEPVMMDQTRGAGGRTLLEPSGLVPKYSVKDTYGKVPSYLTQRKEEEMRTMKDHEARVSAMSKAGAPRQLTSEERQSLLDGLKANWTQLHRDYQGLSVVVDTESKKQRKKSMEARLAQLEADIQRVERHPVIYVED